MNAIAATLAAAGLHMLTSLLTEAFLKRAIIAILEFLAKKTESDLDDKVLKAAKEAWGLKESE